MSFVGKPKKLLLLGMLGVLLLTTWLGIRDLITNTLWFDEYVSIFESGGAQYGPISPTEMAFRVAKYDTWPPGYNFLLVIWGHLVGWTPFAGRFFSLLAGLLAVACLYHLGRELNTKKPLIALAGAVLMGSSAFYVHYLHELRGYTLHLLFVCLSVWFYWRIINRPTQRKIQIVFILALAGLLYGNPVGQVVFGLLFLYHVLFARRLPRWRATAVQFLWAGGLYSPWIVVMLIHVFKEYITQRGQDPNWVLGSMFYSYSNGIPLLALLICAYLAIRLRDQAVGYLWFVLVGVLAVSLTVNSWASFLFHPRLLMTVLPIFVLLVAYGLNYLPTSRLVMGAFLCLWIGLGIWKSSNTAFIDNLPGAIHSVPWAGLNEALSMLAQRSIHQDAIFFHLAPIKDEVWYQDPLNFLTYGQSLRFMLFATINNLSTKGAITDFPTGVAAFIGQAPLVWMAMIPDVSMDSYTQQVRRTLSTLNYVQCSTAIDRPDMRLDLYGRDQTICQAQANIQ